MIENIRNITFQVKCGAESCGTAFLISKSFAITAYHVVEDYESNPIELYQNNSFVTKCNLHEIIDEKYRTLDIVLLCLENELNSRYFFKISNPIKLITGINWKSWGFPSAKITDGEPMFENCTVNQQLDYLKNDKIDILLNHNQKFDSYEGLSGAPLIIDEYIVGIINTELTVNKKSKELNALSVKHWSELLNALNIPVEEKEFGLISSPNKRTRLEIFFAKLNESFNKQNEVTDYIDDLKRYIDERDRIPLEQKLKDGEKEYLYENAAWLKIQYEKKLELIRFNLPAQEIHAFILGIILSKFTNLIYPLIKANTPDELIFETINSNIVVPIMNIIDEHDYRNILKFSEVEIQGMIYSLFGKCHLKWKL